MAILERCRAADVELGQQRHRNLDIGRVHDMSGVLCVCTDDMCNTPARKLLCRSGVTISIRSHIIMFTHICLCVAGLPTSKCLPIYVFVWGWPSHIIMFAHICLCVGLAFPHHNVCPYMSLCGAGFPTS